MSSNLVMHMTGALVISLDPEAQNPGQALLIALTTAIASIGDEMAAQIDEDVRTAARMHEAGHPAFGPYFPVARMAWTAFQEIRGEHRLIAQQVGDDLD